MLFRGFALICNALFPYFLFPLQVDTAISKLPTPPSVASLADPSFASLCQLFVAFFPGDSGEPFTGDLRQIDIGYYYEEDSGSD